MARKRGNNGIMLFGMLAGSIIGAAVGLVFAPADGEENRKHLAEWTNARLEEVKNTVSDKVSNIGG